MTALPFAHGGPPLTGTLRAVPEDFEVDEVLGFEPEGNGEHAFVRIEKRDANTEWVARRLADALGIAPVAVGFCGLKDRHALTRQTFSVHLPGRPDPDWHALAIEGVRVLGAIRHTRKLKRGAHRGNRFRIRLREVLGDPVQTERVLAVLAAHGVPNYFGAQRFGRNGDNLRAAHALFTGARLGRSERAFALSAARSQLFNEVLARRVRDATWNTALDGEVWMLAGSHSIFGPQQLDAEILRRLAEGDIDPTGPLWGRGDLRSTGAVRGIEAAVALADDTLASGLARADLRQERRTLRLRAGGMRHVWEDETTLRLEFALPSGTFATAIVREICSTGE